MAGNQAADEFYVGYAPAPPRETKRLIVRVIVGLVGLVLVLAVVLIFGQQPFSKASFEFRQNRDFSGTVELKPYPSLLVARPNASGYSGYLLVGEGKHGADEAVQGFAQKQVTLRGSLIYRNGHTMIEIVSGSLKAQRPGEAEMDAATLGTVTAVGEIVDSKCYLGVMNPGRSKVHRDCAVRCISGGVPPALVTADGLYLLAGMDGRQLHREILGMVAEKVEITGTLLRSGDTLTLRADPADYRRLN
jgi:hypothetical protein